MRLTLLQKRAILELHRGGGWDYLYALNGLAGLRPYIFEDLQSKGLVKIEGSKPKAAWLTKRGVEIAEQLPRRINWHRDGKGGYISSDGQARITRRHPGWFGEVRGDDGQWAEPSDAEFGPIEARLISEVKDRFDDFRVKMCEVE